MGTIEARKGLAMIARCVVLAGVIAVTGCAADKRIELAYRAVPTEGLAQAPQVGVYVAPVGDRRTDPEKVGEIQRPYFWRSIVHPNADVRLGQGTVPAWVRDALVSELELRAYRLADADDRTAWQLHGIVLEVYYHEGGMIFARPSAGVTIQCQLVRGDVVMPSKFYSGKAKAKDPDSTSGDPQHLLETALRRLLKDLIGDLEAARKDGAEKS